jgi:hypothetical protein
MGDMRAPVQKSGHVFETTMSIDPFLTGHAFDSKAIREMSLALEVYATALACLSKMPREG